MIVPYRHVQKIDKLASLFRIADLKPLGISTGQEVAKLDLGHQGVEPSIEHSMKLKKLFLYHITFLSLLFRKIFELDVEDMNST